MDKSIDRVAIHPDGTVMVYYTNMTYEVVPKERVFEGGFVAVDEEGKIQIV